MKLTGGSHCGASLLWLSLFGSSLPCGWLIGGQARLQTQTPPYSKSHQILQALWPPKTICHKVVFVYVCSRLPRFQVVFFVNHH